MSIVISAKNEEKNLDLLVDSLLNQKYPKSCYEIIIANDKSTDSTLNKLNTFKIYFPEYNFTNVLYIYKEE